MKSTITFLALLFIGMVSQAQTDGSKLLEELKSNYKNKKSVQLDFNLVIEPSESEKQIYSGKMVQKGEKYRLDSEFQTVISDGETAYIYLPNSEEVQIVNASDQIAGLSPSHLLNSFDQEEYKMRMIKDNEFRVVELIPTDKMSDYFKLKVFIHFTQNLVSKIKIFDKNGDRYELIIQSQKFDEALKEAIFIFDENEFPNAFIEDLRID